MTQTIPKSKHDAPPGKDEQPTPKEDQQEELSPWATWVASNPHHPRTKGVK